MKGIRNLFESDCLEVLRLNAMSLPGVALLDSAEFRRLLSFENVHLAAESSGQGLNGYLLAFPSSAAYDGEEFMAFAKACRAPFIYIDQVAVDRERRRLRIASALYDALGCRARAKSIFSLCCEVNLVPPNPGSLVFHQEAGFVQSGELSTKDGRTVALMTRRLHGAGE